MDSSIGVAEAVGLTQLGLGCAWLGPPRSSAADAQATLRAALDAGIAYLDTAPLYNAGASERCVGEALRSVHPSSLRISTKVGRRIEMDHGGIGRVVADYTPAGVRRSLEGSLERLGLERVDIVYLHDPQNAGEDVLATYAELVRMRDEGLVEAIGVGVNEAAYAERFVGHTAVDLVLLAGRWTLLDQTATKFLGRCLAVGARVVAAGVYNTGILADPYQQRPRYNYRPAEPAVVERARRLDALCAEHGVPLKAAALQFPLMHQAVATVLVGAATRAEVDENAALFRQPIPHDLWSDLREHGFIPGAVETPTTDVTGMDA